MTDAGERQPRDWATYYATTAERAPRPTLLKALDVLGPPAPDSLAVDLGCGGGRDTVEMLRRGWRVLAIDAEQSAIDSLRDRPDLPADARLETLVGRFETTAWSDAELVNASFALPLCPPSGFDRLWPRLVASLAPGGCFAGQLFGDRDSFRDRPGITTMTREEARARLDGLDVLLFDEEETDAVTPRGTPKHWHLFHVVARRPR